MKPFHKRLFLVVLVVAPMYWLVFTEDGRRRSDTLILWVMGGGDPIDLNFKALDSHYSMKDWKTVFDDIDWQCEDQTSAFGEQICFSKISSYNGIPAYYLSVFFQKDYVTAVKLAYRHQYHQKLGLDLQQQLGAPMQKTHETSENDMLQWQTDHGVVLIKTELKQEEEASLIWLAK